MIIIIIIIIIYYIIYLDQVKPRYIYLIYEIPRS